MLLVTLQWQVAHSHIASIPDVSALMSMSMPMYTSVSIRMGDWCRSRAMVGSKWWS